MESITLPELGKKLRKRNIKHYKIKDSDKIIITDNTNRSFLIEDLKILTKGSHIILKKDNITVTLNAKIQKTKKALIASILGLTISIASSLISTLPFFDRPSDPIEERIKELNNIQSSLSMLNEYINTQKNKLQELDKSINSLKEQKQLFENIISLDKEKVQSILEYQKIEEYKKIWFERILSFIIGVFSSLTATFIYIFIRSKKYISSDDE